MTVCIAFYHGDLAECRRLLLWIERLGKCLNHDAMLVTQADTPWHEVQEMRDIAERIFSRVEVVTNPEPVNGWPQAFNSLFLAAAKVRAVKGLGPWLWLEPDAVPLKSGWLDALESDWAKCGKPCMGTVVLRGNNDTRLPERHMPATAVYDWSMADVFGPFCEQPGAADIAAADAIMPLMAQTNLIQHFWGRMNLPPTFADRKGPGDPENLLTSAFIRPDAVLFHRNKDGSLIRLLQERLFPGTLTENREFTIVLPFHNGDYTLMLRNLQWISELCGLTRFSAVVACDTGTLKAYAEMIANMARAVFRTVDCFWYPPPKHGGWPQGANHAFQNTARQMQAMGRPWLWWEADATLARADGIDDLQARYVTCGKPLMGAIVPGMGHMNGVGVYPSNFPSLSPTTMQITNGAFDTHMTKDVQALTADASDLIQHAWCILNHRLAPCGSGPTPSFKTQQSVNEWLNPKAALFHRVKDNSLIDRLRERRQRMATK